MKVEMLEGRKRQVLEVLALKPRPLSLRQIVDGVYPDVSNPQTAKRLTKEALDALDRDGKIKVHKTEVTRAGRSFVATTYSLLTAAESEDTLFLRGIAEIARIQHFLRAMVCNGCKAVTLVRHDAGPSKCGACGALGLAGHSVEVERSGQ